MQLYDYYVKATSLMGRPSVRDILEEINELLEDKNIEELVDVTHSICRFLYVPNKVVWTVAKRTAMKHATRTLIRGCPRSERNCKAAAEKCCCKGEKSEA
jgi:hypothetical protein